jgi:ribosome biogenesis protein Nip4
MRSKYKVDIDNAIYYLTSSPSPITNAVPRKLLGSMLKFGEKLCSIRISNLIFRHSYLAIEIILLVSDANNIHIAIRAG